MDFIYRVHKQLRDVNEKAYEPEIIAIGPYHRDKARLNMMEEHKKRYLDLLLERKKQELDTYISAIGELEEAARKCYAECISLSREEFTMMLVRDGCFIIELIRKYNKKGAKLDNDPISQMGWVMSNLQRDLMLFENQIPFFVLRRLFDLIEVPGLHERLIYLVFKFWENLHPGGEFKRRKNMNPEKIKHLLDLIHQYYCPPLAADDHVLVNIDTDETTASRKNLSLSDIDKDKINASRRKHLFIPSATELTYANVEFKRKKHGALFDTDFHRGVMLMPSLTIEERTECLFRNLIAYEQYISYHETTFFTDYVRLLNCLINSSRDVEILSQCGILDNWLGDDELVVSILSRLAESVAGGHHFLYADTFARLNKHCRRPWNRLWAPINRKYFSSPWAYPSSIAAVVVFSLTVAQTVCSILQVV